MPRELAEVVLLPNEYRTFATECLDWAKTARSAREGGIFLQMADTWLRVAVLHEEWRTFRIKDSSGRAQEQTSLAP